MPLRRLAAAVTATWLLLPMGAADARPQPRHEEWWLRAWQIPDKVWPLTQGHGVIVGLIDTGVQADLPDLRNAVLKGAEFPPIGPIHGDGVVDKDKKLGGHGTGMAALISGQGYGTGMVGIAPQARILPIIGSDYNLDRSIRYAVDHGAKVLNFSEYSPGPSCPPETQDAIAYAIDHDVVIVAGAGNDPRSSTSVEYPQNCAGVLVVGGIDYLMDPWPHSTPGSNVMISAPAADVGSIGKAGIFGNNDGTSSASALTSGVVALMRAKFPKMPGREVVQRLLYTAHDVGPKGWDEKSGYGALMPFSAMTATIPKNAPNAVFDRFDRLQVASHDTTTQANAERASESDKPVTFSRTLLLTCIGGVLSIALAVALTLIVRRRVNIDSPRKSQ